MHEARIRARARMLPRAFIEEVAGSGDDDATAHAAVAGLVVLRTVDRWVAEGCRGGFDIAGASTAVQQIETGNVARAILGEVLDAIAVGGIASAPTVAERLLAYAGSLEYDAKWSMAMAVCEFVVQHAGVASSDEAVSAAYVRQGRCLRALGQFSESRRAYSAGKRIAERLGDVRCMLLADIGCARVDVDEGNLTEADAALRIVIARAEHAQLKDVCSMAIHDRAVVAGTAGAPFESTLLAYQALQLCEDPVNRDRILFDIGENLRLQGLGEASRDAFLLLSCTAREQSSRWHALILLMRIAGDDHAELVFDEYRRVLASVPLPMLLEIEFGLQVGYALRMLGRHSESAMVLERAAALAKQRGFAQEVRNIERAQAGESDCVTELAPNQLFDLSEIIQTLRAMREATIAG